PADGLIVLPEKAIGLGVPRFVWLKALNTSALNCRLTFSERGLFLASDKSTFARPGPRNTPLPKFPQVAGAGMTKAFASNHCVCFRGSTRPEKDELSEGRSGFRRFPSADRFDPICGVNGKPLNSAVIPLNCQPLAKRDNPCPLFDPRRSKGNS